MEINLNNYEEFLLCYVDGELSPAEEETLRRFLQEHPELKKELELLQATRLRPDEATAFGDKSALYRKEKPAKTKPLYRKWWLSAAAAAILAFAIISLLRPIKQPVHHSIAITPVLNATDTLVKSPGAPHRSVPEKLKGINLAVKENKAGSRQEKRKAAPGPAKEKAPAETLALASSRHDEPAPMQHKNNPAAADSVSAQGALAEATGKPSRPLTPVESLQSNSEIAHRQPAAVPSPEPAAKPLIAQVQHAATIKQEVLSEETEKLVNARQNIDEKINNAQGFVARKFQEFRKKGIRIGKLEIVMN